MLDKYYYKTDKIPIYSTALLLYPLKCLKYLRQSWNFKQHEGVISNSVGNLSTVVDEM